MTASNSNSAGQILVQKRDAILREWENRVRAEIQSANELREPILIDTLPSFLDNMAKALSTQYSGPMKREFSNVAQEHGSERARLSRYEPDQLIREYQILRDAILHVLSAHVRLSEEDKVTIQRSIDEGVCEAMTAYFLVNSRIREQFVATLGHDLRNPLNAVRMTGELIASLARDSQDEQTLRQDLEGLAHRIVRNARRADRMIQDLLDASVVQIGEQIPLKIGECNMLTIIRDAVIELTAKEQERIRIKGSPVRGYWDCDGIRRAVENLVSNALKYSRVEAPITISVATVLQRAVVQVHNEGDPIPIEEQELLFQVFRRSRAARVGGQVGWGIGLALVRGVAEAHGGSIVVESSVEKGTTFTIDVPIDTRPFQARKHN